jgi:hypothetical protein
MFVKCILISSTLLAGYLDSSTKLELGHVVSSSYADVVSDVTGKKERSDLEAFSSHWKEYKSALYVAQIRPSYLPTEGKGISPTAKR